MRVHQMQSRRGERVSRSERVDVRARGAVARGGVDLLPPSHPTPTSSAPPRSGRTRARAHDGLIRWP